MFNRILPIFECVSIETAEKTLYVTNQRLENCEILMKDTSIAHSNATFYACFKCKFGFSGRLKRTSNKFY